jgi:DNA-directed RNA polymerase alpha subunit
MSDSEQIDLDTPVGHVDGFNYRALGRFKYAQIATLRELLEYNEEDLADVRSMGPGTLANIKAVLADLGLSLADPH